MTENLYEILGVSKNATKEEIEKAYKSKARQYHPDRFTNKTDQEKATEQFQKISEAYRTLSDESKRRIYDSTGTKDGQGGFDGGFGGGGFGGGQYQFYGFENIYEQFGGGKGFGGFEHGFDLNDFFNMFSGGGHRQTINKYNLDITIEEAFMGSQKQIMVTENVACSKCTNTKGYCTTCKGTRYTKNTKQQEVNIPAGVKTRDAIAINSTTHIIFNIKSSKYTIDGVNLICNMEISDNDFRTSKPLSLTDLDGTMYTVDISKYKVATAKVVIDKKGLWTDTRKVNRGTLIINLSVKFNK